MGLSGYGEAPEDSFVPWGRGEDHVQHLVVETRQHLDNLTRR
jgi:hypothetical protein